MPSILISLLLPILVLSEYTPVVLWHGMDDTCCDPYSMDGLRSGVEQDLPGVYIYSIALNNDSAVDRDMTYVSNMNEEVERVCGFIAADPNLAKGYNAIGCSQGGQFLRAVAQRCPSPPMKVLLTLGSQHQGVFGWPGCYGDNPLCDEVRQICERGAYVDFVQETTTTIRTTKPATRPRTNLSPSSTMKWFAVEPPIILSIFLFSVQNNVYKENLLKLEQLILVEFDQDVTVIPRESAIFGFYKENDIDTIIPYNETSLYTEDRIGLKTLNQSGRLQIMYMQGAHMQIDYDVLSQILDKYFK